MTESSLSSKKIKAVLDRQDIEIKIYTSTDSTNSEAKRHIFSGGKAPCAFVADTQTEGRGRMGRAFYSPSKTGLYLSLLLKAKGAVSDSILMTSASAVAIRRAILKCFGVDTKIKWVNDLYLSDKKVCGILCESFIHENDLFFIVGVGININTQRFPKELAEKAGALTSESVDRSRLAAACIFELMSVWENLACPSIINEYRSSSLVLGRQVIFSKNGQEIFGFAESIDDVCHLYVRDENKVLHKLSSGEISLKLKE